MEQWKQFNKLFWVNSQSGFIYEQIIDNIKKNTKTYTEVFGAFWVYMNEDFSFANNIVYNDMNQYLTNFYACAIIENS